MRKINKILLVIFDMDGLMFDTERIAISAWDKAGKDFGVNIDSDMVIETIGLDIDGTRQVFQKYLRQGFPFDEVRKLRVKYALNYIEEHGIPVKEGLHELIEFLDENSILKAVATSTERYRAVKYLEFANIKDKFDIIVCGNEVNKGKPEPDIFLKAANMLNCCVEECIVLEDSENGIKAAASAGMLPIFIPDIRRPSNEAKKLIFKEFDSLLGVKDFLKTVL